MTNNHSLRRNERTDFSRFWRVNQVHIDRGGEQHVMPRVIPWSDIPMPVIVDERVAADEVRFATGDDGVRWRVVGLAPASVLIFSEANPLDMATPRELATLDAYIEGGSHKAAAHALGLQESTSKGRIAALLKRTGCSNVAVAAYLRGLQRARGLH